MVSNLGTTRPGCAKPRPPPFRALSARPLPIRNRYEKSALEPDTVRLLVRAKRRADGIYVFRSGRGGKMSTDMRVICERAGRTAGFGFRVRPHMFGLAAGF